MFHFLKTLLFPRSTKMEMFLDCYDRIKELDPTLAESEVLKQSTTPCLMVIYDWTQEEASQYYHDLFKEKQPTKELIIKILLTI